jgi:predicted transcriptional regulator
MPECKSMKSHELFAELSSENRLSILKALEKEPLKFSQLTTIINITSPEAARQLNRLFKGGFISKDIEGYYSLTSLGKLVVVSIPNLEVLAQRSNFFLHHDTSAIPSHLLRELDAFEGVEEIQGVFELVNKTTQLFEEIHKYAWYLTDSFPSFFIPRIEKKLDEGVNFRVISPWKLGESFLSDVSAKILKTAEIRSIDELRIVINVNDRFGLLALPGPDGKLDRDYVLLGYEKRFKDWCKEVFEYYFNTSKRI